MSTRMYQEAQDAPNRVRAQLARNAAAVQVMAKRLRANPPRLVVTCARGSSAHAATYAKYLIETRLGIPVMPSALSVDSVYGAARPLPRPHLMNDMLFLCISQSGQSPDLLAAANAAKAAGAFVVAIVNVETSPLARLADTIIPIAVGVEKSVAATKSFIGSMSVIAQITAEWADDKDILTGLETLPDTLSRASALDWQPAQKHLLNAGPFFVISRGLGLGIACEAALKFKETCGLYAEGFSAAEVKHGPMTLIGKGDPVFIFSTADETQPGIDETAKTFIERGANVICAGAHYDGATELDFIPCPNPVLRPLALIQSFYNFVNALALARGYNPDTPSYLNKATATL